MPKSEIMFTLKEFGHLSRVVKQNIMDADPNIDRSTQIPRDMKKAFCFYRHMYEDVKKQKTVQSTLL
jgi:hypothetical protein